MVIFHSYLNLPEGILNPRPIIHHQAISNGSLRCLNYRSMMNDRPGGIAKRSECMGGTQGRFRRFWTLCTVSTCFDSPSDDRMILSGWGCTKKNRAWDLHDLRIFPSNLWCCVGFLENHSSKHRRAASSWQRARGFRASKGSWAMQRRVEWARHGRRTSLHDVHLMLCNCLCIYCSMNYTYIYIYTQLYTCIVLYITILLKCNRVEDKKSRNRLNSCCLPGASEWFGAGIEFRGPLEGWWGENHGNELNVAVDVSENGVYNMIYTIHDIHVYIPKKELQF